MPIHGALIGAVVRNGTAIFPHSEDVLQAGDRVIVFTRGGRRARGSSRRSERAASPPARRRAEARARRRTRRRRSTSSARSGSTSGLRRALPDRGGALVRGAGLAVPAAGAITSGVGYRLERLTAGAAARVGRARGLPRRLGDVARRRRLSRRCRTSSRAATSSATRSTRTSRGCRASRRPARASSPTTTSSRSRSPCGAQFTQWLGGMGIIVLAIAVLPRLRVGGRQLMESELPGPEIAQLSERIRRPRGCCGCSTSG